MSKTKHRAASASQRREQTRQERQQRIQTEQKQSSRSRGKRSRRSRGSNPWLMVSIVVGLVLVVVVVFVVISQQQKPSTASATSAVWKSITSISPKALATVVNGNVDDAVKKTFYQVKNPPPVLTGPNGRPEVFYMGAEYCPYCAAQRWGLIVALSRFGIFSNVAPNISGEDSVPTYTFHQSSYTSQYLDFVPVELEDNQSQPLETLTSEQNAIVSKYDASPYTQPHAAGQYPFPFVSIGNQVVITGATVDSSLLIGHTYDDIANQIKDPTTDLAKSVLGTANYLTAAICSLTNNQPANVCSAEPVPQLKVALTSLAPRAFAAPGPSMDALADFAPMLEPRRKLF